MDHNTQWSGSRLSRCARPGLRLKTLHLYRYLLRRHLLPGLVIRAVGDIREPHVRRWRRELLDGGVSEITTAKAYRLLRPS